MEEKNKYTTTAYQFIANEKELEWFFNHCVPAPNMNESYSAVLACRQKKLSKEQRETLGMPKKDSLFMDTFVFTNEKINANNDRSVWTERKWDFKRFLKGVRHFNVDTMAYETDLGYSMPYEAMVILFYINPCDDIIVGDAVMQEFNEQKTAICKAMLNGKDAFQTLSNYTNIVKLYSNIKHEKALHRSSKNWVDFDIDVPDWFKQPRLDLLPDGITAAQCPKYYREMMQVFTNTFGKGNYVVIDTGGGYHILVRCNSIKSDPNKVCEAIKKIYYEGVQDGNLPYIDEKCQLKFEVEYNAGDRIPGVPLPGTYQYGRPVTVLNKEDFN